MLQGTLNDFSLPDVFSLLALTKKSGALRVTSDGTDGRVYFRDGSVCLALSDATRVPLGARLVNAGLVDQQKLEELVREHSSSAAAVTEALINSGVVEDRVLGVYLREQIVDAVFELIRLEEGSFTFDAGDPALSRGVGLGVVEVVGEANRRLEEWAAISRRVAAPSAVLAMVPSATTGREGVTLTTEQWDLLTLVDGRRSVADVVELTGKGEFATCRVLGDLIEAGLVESKDPSSGEQTRLDKLIAAREALRSLEHVGRPGGLAPHLSSAADADKGSKVRWIEPAREETVANGTQPAKPAVLTPRTRVAEAPLGNAGRAPEPSSPEPASPAATPVASSSGAESRPSSKEAPAAGEGKPSSTAVAVADRQPDPVTQQIGVEASADAPDAPVHSIDRAQVARELASLGLDDMPEGPRTADKMTRLTRDEEVNKGLLLRLIDGVKGA